MVIWPIFGTFQMDNSEEPIEFECNRWLDIKEDDGLIVRELTAGGAQLLNSKSLVNLFSKFVPLNVRRCDFTSLLH